MSSFNISRDVRHFEITYPIFCSMIAVIIYKRMTIFDMKDSTYKSKVHARHRGAYERLRSFTLDTTGLSRPESLQLAKYICYDRYKTVI
jgi:hypothetical protein